MSFLGLVPVKRLKEKEEHIQGLYLTNKLLSKEIDDASSFIKTLSSNLESKQERIDFLESENKNLLNKLSVVKFEPSKQIPSEGTSIKNYSIEEYNLTEREIQIIIGFANDKTNEQIGKEMGYSGRTIEGYKTRIIQKTKCASNLSFYHFAKNHYLI